MIYATTRDGKILIGLSKRNLELLQQDRPIYKTGNRLPTLIILYGETEEAILKDLLAHGIELPIGAKNYVENA